MVTITGEYQGDLHCSSVHGPSGSVLLTDAPKDNQGRGEAFSPTDLVATALASCIATTLAIAARKHGVDLAGLRYAATKEMSADAPRRIARLRVILDLPPSARRLPAGLVENTAHACPVHRSLAPEVEQVIELNWS